MTKKSNGGKGFIEFKEKKTILKGDPQAFVLTPLKDLHLVFYTLNSFLLCNRKYDKS